MSQIWNLTASEIATAVRSKALSATEVTKAHLQRIADVNPTVNAVVQEFPEDALQAARQVDEAIARGEDPGVLCGVPVTIKVNVDQEGQATTNGLRLQENLVAQHDSPVVSNIRKAGGVIIGRTNTPAFSLRWFTNNNLHGQTLNPRNKAITPGGSSGGAAAAVAAGLCAIGHGTDIAGSIRYPAYACGLHGLRPTFGRIPAYNASAPDRFIGAQIMAVSGPIARSISDIGISLAAMAAPDLRDPWYVSAPMAGGDYQKRAALTIAPDGMPVADEVRAALFDTAERLKAAGWIVEEVACPPMRLAAEINAQLWMADTQFGAREMIEREAEPDSQFVFEHMTRDAGEVGFDTLMKSLQARVALVRQWELFLKDYPVLICPVSGELPFAQQQDVSSEDAFAAAMEAQLIQRALPVIGVPALSVATGEADHRPVGVQLIGPRFREDILLAAGQDIENAGNVPVVTTPNWA
ncbi:Glutamyl-tRNA(Gln) amidotransferase subunit A [Thalassovita gelatinovora]|uniref:Glutamyl-tRNA(Gln) amidotransferase subunit A n=1 Tax=Thalassovita gelatinovora TaxID=53501 RepID=A0A0P1FCE4_THAGE|nr:amidase family protein [Thalassovita gelatinovora]QIZ80455.1 amidase family protein [Thalassovita gelatinovora]CUH65870.1 Glutamyl-tRNA(Gln) amidotransferase subunit A [Thalassovita gelatinovora]SEQ72953.1 amidase [Thalassovita gelatinovora]